MARTTLVLGSELPCLSVIAQTETSEASTRSRQRYGIHSQQNR